MVTITERDILEMQARDRVRVPQDLPPVERFNDGEIEIYIYTPLSTVEYQNLGADLFDFLVDRGLMVQVDVTNTADLFSTEVI